VIQVKSKNLLTDENRDKFIPIQESEFYKNASPETQASLASKGELFVSVEPVNIDKSNSTYQNFTNGIMNNAADAIKNGVSQTHTKDDTNINLTVNYNPTHGLLGDGLESAVDKFGGTTGMAEQTGEFIKEVTTSRGNSGSNFAAHSQGNLLTNSGVNYINSLGSYENGGFKDKTYFLDPNIDKNDPRYKDGLLTFAGYGSPVNTTTMKETLQGANNEGPFDFIGNYTNENDFVGEVLGGNKGNNDDRGWERVTDPINPVQYINGGNLFVNDNIGLRPSPHSNYECDKLSSAQCGDRP
jgi:filamentous hemagglutinin